MQKILFANIGWMKRYRGHSNSDRIKGGGSYNSLISGMPIAQMRR